MLELTLKLIKVTEPGHFTFETEFIEGGMDSDVLLTLKNKHESDGKTLVSWTVSNALPDTEGRIAALAGATAESNPYNKSNWRFPIWLKGWFSIQQSNLDGK